MVIARGVPLKELDFQGKDPEEDFQFQFHQHWIRLLWPFIKLLGWNAIIVGIAYSVFMLAPASDDVTRRIVLAFLTTFFVLAHLEFLKRIYTYLLYVIVVTDKKIHRIKKTLVLTNDHLSIDLWMVQDIEKSQEGLLQNLLGFGSIILEAQETVMRLHFVPAVSKKYEQILKLRERARKSMGYLRATELPQTNVFQANE
ncbi:hypothetical protein COU80_04100 [Candidatus Peregrinibacteria bacterium CG10_big_fil_rev_8_21_14_0_10_55_24]|nr:MAG: hypothetical protein COU80_04100 [Candidatus Peregrinibacteria bacterium CG10_big_fil_rev_8_21_14_0_10_55_24]